MKYRFTVTVDVVCIKPCVSEDGFEFDRLDRDTVKSHIRESVFSWGGQYHAMDPLFPSNIREVKVR